MRFQPKTTKDVYKYQRLVLDGKIVREHEEEYEFFKDMLRRVKKTKNPTLFEKLKKRVEILQSRRIRRTFYKQQLISPTAEPENSYFPPMSKYIDKRILSKFADTQVANFIAILKMHFH
jgi:hypothetical protein